MNDNTKSYFESLKYYTNRRCLQRNSALSSSDSQWHLVQSVTHTHVWNSLLFVPATSQIDLPRTITHYGCPLVSLYRVVLLFNLLQSCPLSWPDNSTINHIPRQGNAFPGIAFIADDMQFALSLCVSRTRYTSVISAYVNFNACTRVCSRNNFTYSVRFGCHFIFQFKFQIQKLAYLWRTSPRARNMNTSQWIKRIQNGETAESIGTWNWVYVGNNTRYMHAKNWSYIIYTPAR